MTDMSPGTNAIVDAALEEGAQSLFAAADVPLARTAELTAAVQGPAARAVLEARIRHIVKNGHTAAADAGIEPYRLLDKAVDMMRYARARCGVTDTNPAGLALARKSAADACALGLAVIDRIDLELAKGAGE